MPNTRTAFEPSPSVSCKENDDWMLTLKDFLVDDHESEEIPALNHVHKDVVQIDICNHKRAYEPLNEDKAARKRLREKERRDQLNFAFKSLHNAMLNVDSSYKIKLPFTGLNNTIHQPYLISKTTTKLEALVEASARKDAEISKIKQEIERLKNGQVLQVNEVSVEKSDMEKKQVQAMNTMMMVPMMIPNGLNMNMNWMQAMNMSGYNEAMMWNNGNKNNHNEKSMAMDASGKEEIQQERHQESGNLAHCA